MYRSSHMSFGAWRLSNITILLSEGIYEMFCREIFGKKPKSLEFGLQPLKIPDSDTVGHDSPRNVIQLNFHFKLITVRVTAVHLCVPLGAVSDALLECPLCPVPSSSGQSALLHQAQRTPRPTQGCGETQRSRGSQLHVRSGHG